MKQQKMRYVNTRVMTREVLNIWKHFIKVNALSLMMKITQILLFPTLA